MQFTAESSSASFIQSHSAEESKRTEDHSPHSKTSSSNIIRPA